MNRKLLYYIVCPRCKNRFTLYIRKIDKSRDEIETGILKCPCETYPIENFIPRLINYQQSELNLKKIKLLWDMEWEYMKKSDIIYGLNQQMEIKNLLARLEINKEFLRDKTVLDAGCGIGRVTKNLSQYTGLAIGLEFSNIIGNYGKDLNAQFQLVQGDILNPPFKDNIFDCIICKGTLHYVSSPSLCIKKMSFLLKRDAYLFFTVYKRKWNPIIKIIEFIRLFSTKLPILLTFRLSFIAIPLFDIVSMAARAKDTKLNLREKPHIIFNIMSSKYLNRLSYREVYDLLKKNALKCIRVGKKPITILAQKISE